MGEWVANDDAEVDRIAMLLLTEWQRVDPKSGVAKHPASYMATFADLARAVLADRATRRPEAEVLGSMADRLSSEALHHAAMALCDVRAYAEALRLEIAAARALPRNGWWRRILWRSAGWLALDAGRPRLAGMCARRAFLDGDRSNPHDLLALIVEASNAAPASCLTREEIRQLPPSLVYRSEGDRDV